MGLEATLEALPGANTPPIPSLSAARIRLSAAMWATFRKRLGFGVGGGLSCSKCLLATPFVVGSVANNIPCVADELGTVVGLERWLAEQTCRVGIPACTSRVATSPEATMNTLRIAVQPRRL